MIWNNYKVGISTPLAEWPSFYFKILKIFLPILSALKLLGDLDLSSPDESDFEDELVSQGRLVIVQLFNVQQGKTDKKYRQEKGIDLNHLSKDHLLWNAHVEINTSHGNLPVDIIDSPVNKLSKQNNKENWKKSQKLKLVCH